jgi:methyltransferase
MSCFWIAFLFVLLQRLGELAIARRNAARIRALGGYEVGADHYRYIVSLHAAFFLSLLTEVYARGREDAAPALVPLALFLAAQVVRIWALASLGRFWNTRIFILPGSEPIRRGPYRFLRHPNYVVVALELFTLPLALGAPLTAVLFSGLNALVLRVRIRVEEQALAEATAYGEAMAEQPRFLPLRKKK